MKLFGATIGATIENPNDEVVVLPKMTTEFMDIFEESLATNMSRSFRSQLEHYCLLQNDSLFFLEKQTDLPHLSQAAGLLLICYNWKKDPLDENINAMSQELSIVTYLPPPYESQSETSREYKNFEFEKDIG